MNNIEQTMLRKRKTVQEKEIEKLITKHLDKLGRTISVMTAKASKVKTLDQRAIWVPKYAPRLRMQTRNQMSRLDIHVFLYRS